MTAITITTFKVKLMYQVIKNLDICFQKIKPVNPSFDRIARKIKKKERKKVIVLPWLMPEKSASIRVMGV